MVPSGLFVPALVAGAAMGRFIGQVIHDSVSSHASFVGT